GRARGARRRGARAADARRERRRDGVPGGGVPGARAGARAERGELRAGAGGRRRARVRGASPPRRHRAADGRLRLPRARARDGRHGGGERALRRRAARGARMTPLFARLTIAGVGLVGGSLAAAVRAAGLVGEVVGFGRTEANLRLAEERGLADRVTRDPAAAVAGADAIVLAAPVGTCAALAAAFRPHARAGALLTDVGSVRHVLVAELEAAWAGVGFRATTRVAASPAELWRDIALANAPALGAALGDFRAALDRLERLVGARDAAGLAAALAAARALRGRLRGEE